MRFPKWVTFILVIAATLIASSVDAAKKTPPGQRTGVYQVWAGGYYSGRGTATVKHKKLSIEIPVTSEAGGSGVLDASNLHIKDNHFSGNGSVMGHSVSINGRLDVPDGVGEEVQSARMVCNFECDDGHKGRIAGYLDEAQSDP